MVSPARTPAASSAAVHSRRLLKRAVSSMPRVSRQATAAGNHDRDRCTGIDPAWADRVRERARGDEREPEHGVVRAHDQREGASAHVVWGAALDERDVGDDGAAVPEAGERHRDGSHPDVRRGRSARDAEREDDQEAHVGLASAAGDQLASGEPTDDEPDARARPRAGRSRSRRRGSERRARNTSARLTAPLASITIDQTTSTQVSACERRTTE